MKCWLCLFSWELLLLCFQQVPSFFENPTKRMNSSIFTLIHFFKQSFNIFRDMLGLVITLGIFFTISSSFQTTIEIIQQPPNFFFMPTFRTTYKGEINLLKLKFYHLGAAKIPMCELTSHNFLFFGQVSPLSVQV